MERERGGGVKGGVGAGQFGDVIRFFRSGYVASRLSRCGFYVSVEYLCGKNGPTYLELVARVLGSTRSLAGVDDG